MTDGLKAFRRIQIGMESIKGTAVAADTRLMGTLTLKPADEWHTPEDEERNSLALLHSHTKVARGIDATFEGRMTYQQILPWLLIGMKGSTSITLVSTGDTGAVKRRTFERTPTAQNKPDALTLQYGDNVQAWRSAYVQAKEIQITVPMRAVATVRASLFGRQETTQAFTSGIAAPTVVDVVGTKAKVYISTAWANLGSSGDLVSNLVINAVVTIPTGVNPIWAADGSLSFSKTGEAPTALQMELTMLMSSVALAEVNKYRDGSLRFIRIALTGDNVEAATSTGAGPWPYYVYIDAAIRYTEPPQLFEGEEQGINTIRLVGRSFEDPTANKDFRVIVQENTATV